MGGEPSPGPSCGDFGPSTGFLGTGGEPLGPSDILLLDVDFGKGLGAGFGAGLGAWSPPVER